MSPESNLESNLFVAYQTLAPITYLFSTLAQAHLFLVNFVYPESPQPYAVYAPHPYLLLAYFTAYAAVQGWWIARLLTDVGLRVGYSAVRLEGDAEEDGVGAGERDGQRVQMAYAPCYIIGNLCMSKSICSTLRYLVDILLVVWPFTFLYQYYFTSQILLIIHTSAQLYAVFILFPRGHTLSQQNGLTHLTAKMNMGFAVLLIWKTWGVVDVNSLVLVHVVYTHEIHQTILAPSATEQIHSGVVFLLLVGVSIHHLDVYTILTTTFCQTVASGPDPTLGLCLSYDLAALYFGPKRTWHDSFMYISALVFVVAVGDWVGAQKKDNKWLARGDREGGHRVEFRGEYLEDNVRRGGEGR